MMYRLIRWLLNKFNYELVSFAEMARMRKECEQRIKIAKGEYDLKFDYGYDNGSYIVRTRLNLPRIFIKRFKSEDYGNLEYAEACARELCNKLNETP